VLGNTSAAEDLVQEVFLQLWRNPQAFDADRGKLAPWLAVIARNRAIDLLRKRPMEDDIDELPISTGVNLEDEASQRLAIGKVRGVLGQLPADQRRLLEMAFFEGLTHTEIANKTGEPLGTVKTRIRSGLLALRKAFSWRSTHNTLIRWPSMPCTGSTMNVKWRNCESISTRAVSAAGNWKLCVLMWHCWRCPRLVRSHRNARVSGW